MKRVKFEEEAATDWEEKVWGKTKLVTIQNNFEVHELEVTAGGYCSRHRHRKWNRFHIFSGKLVVELFADSPRWPSSKPIIDRILGPGDFFEVAPDTWHRFRAEQDTHCIELYWIGVDPQDIERADVGGMQRNVLESSVAPVLGDSSKSACRPRFVATPLASSEESAPPE